MARIWLCSHLANTVGKKRRNAIKFTKWSERVHRPLLYYVMDGNFNKHFSSLYPLDILYYGLNIYHWLKQSFSRHLALWLSSIFIFFSISKIGLTVAGAATGNSMWLRYITASKCNRKTTNQLKFLLLFYWPGERRSKKFIKLFQSKFNLR